MEYYSCVLAKIQTIDCENSRVVTDYVQTVEKLMIITASKCNVEAGKCLTAHTMLISYRF